MLGLAGVQTAQVLLYVSGSNKEPVARIGLARGLARRQAVLHEAAMAAARQQLKDVLGIRPVVGNRLGPQRPLVKGRECLSILRAYRVVIDPIHGAWSLIVQHRALPYLILLVHVGG